MLCIVDTINVIEKLKPDNVEKILPKNIDTMPETATENKLFVKVLDGAGVEKERSVISDIEKIKRLAEILETLGDKILPLIMDNSPAEQLLTRVNDGDTLVGGSLRKENGANNIRSLHVFRT